MRQKNIPADDGHFLRTENDCACAVKKIEIPFLKKTIAEAFLN